MSVEIMRLVTKFGVESAVVSGHARRNAPPNEAMRQMKVRRINLKLRNDRRGTSGMEFSQRRIVAAALSSGSGQSSVYRWRGPRKWARARARAS